MGERIGYFQREYILFYSEFTVATRSGPYPAQMVTGTAVTRSSPYPNQIMNQHLETTSTSPTELLWLSGRALRQQRKRLWV